MNARTSVVPDLIDMLITVLTGALPDVTVTDGVPTGMDPGDYLMVGVDDPDVASWDSADTTQTWANATMTGRNEQGTITCAIATWTGDAAPKACRDRAYAIGGVVQTLLRDKTQLPIPGLWKTSFASHRLQQAQNDDGSTALLTFQIEFNARI